MAIEYDETVIERFADRLYRRAGIIVGRYTLLGLLLGAAAAIAIGNAQHSAPGAGEMLFLAIPGAVVGYLFGSDRAFTLRLAAQSALCQLQIERNTRKQTVEK